MRNLVLIGLPGSGKTMLGSWLAEELHRDFFDSDVLVEQKTGEKIPALFARGEEYFRNQETEALQALAVLQGVIIATGGGAVLRPENMQALKQNGVIVFLNRSPERIQQDLMGTEGRPLLAGDFAKIFTLHHERLELYEKYADYIVYDGAGWENMAQQVLNLAKEMWT